MNADHKATATEQDQTVLADQAQQRHQDARRRLLKAATVAPVIYTLPTGGALAATSSTCREDSVVAVSEQTDENGDPTGNLVGGGKTFTPGGDSVTFYSGGESYTLEGDNVLVATSCWDSINAQTARSTNNFQRIV